MMVINMILTLINSFLILNIISDILETKTISILKRSIGVLIIFITNILINKIPILSTYGGIINILLIYIISYFVFEQGYRKTLISTFIMYMLSFILEVILVCFFAILNVKLDTLTYFQSLIFNIFTAVLMILMLNTNKVKKIKKIAFDNAKKVTWITLVSFVILIFPKLTIILYEKLNSKIIFLCICFLTLIIIILMLVSIINDLSRKKLLNEYEVLNNYLQIQEKLLEERIVKQHEYENQLILIKNMIKDDNIERYIGELLKKDCEHGYKIGEVNKIPIKGIKGLIYYKCNYAYEKGIDIKLDIGTIENKKISNLESKDLIDLTKILGIFIDNAIEAVMELANKNISISIFINDDNKLVISIANNFDSSINVEKILKKKHTTKGIGHGYGLILASDIIKSNKRIENKTEYISNIFIQNIYYDLKDL